VKTKELLKWLFEPEEMAARERKAALAKLLSKLEKKEIKFSHRLQHRKMSRKNTKETRMKLETCRKHIKKANKELRKMTAEKSHSKPPANA
jgi:hypothetical protein